MGSNMPDPVQLISEGFNLNPRQRSLFLQIAWVSFVTFHILWVCGWLGFAGLATPFARAADFNQLQASSNITASLSIAQEIRAQVQLLCETLNPTSRNAIITTIDKLQVDYIRYSPSHQSYPLPSCQGKSTP